MRDYIVATASTSDLTSDYLEQHQIPFIRYTYTVNDTIVEDDCRESSREEVYQGMRKGDLLQTSMISEQIYYDFFCELLESGKDVLYLDMSRKMSVSFENALHAAEKVRDKYPEQTLYVMDTYCISGGLGLLAPMNSLPGFGKLA